MRDSGGNYHLVYENNGEICYEKRTNSGNALSEFRRLSNGDGNNRFPCITERSGKLYVVWQRQPSSSSFNYDIHYAHSNDGGLSWPTEYVLATTSFTSAINPLPVIQASIPSANKLMVAFRGGSGVAITSRYYANSDLSVSPQSASDWLTKQVSGTTASNAKSPSLIYRTNETGNFQITWDNGTDVLYRKFDGTNWGATTNLSSLLGAAASAHQFASFSVSADDKRHVAWHGLDASLNKKAIFVRELSGTTVTEFYGNGVDYTYPSITGMTASFGFNSAAVLFWYDDNGTNRNVRSSYFNGNCWSGKPYGSIQSTNALHVSSAISNPPSSSTRAVWRRTGNAPYSFALSNVITSGGTQACQDLSSLPKSQSVADSEFVYSRQLLFMLDSTAVLAVRLFAPEITGESLSLDFPQVAESDSLTAATLLDKLRFDFAIPANAEELKLHAEAFALNAGRLLQNGRSSLQPGFEILDQNNRRLALVEAGALTLQGEFKLTKTLTVPIAALRGKTVRLRPVLSNLDLNRVRGTLVHAYGPQDIGAQTNAGQPAPLAQHETASLVAAHPNPFNPSTQIRFLMPQAGLAALRLFNTNGQLVRELLHEERNAGEYVVTWNGRNENGEQAASGVYFIHFEGAGQKQVSKLTLMR